MSDLVGSGFGAFDPDAIPDLTALPRPRPAAPRPTSRRARRTEAALVRAEVGAKRAAAPGGVAPLLVVEHRERPHVRLGLAWAGVTVAAAVAGTPVLGVWFGLVAALAAGQLVRGWRHKGARPLAAVSMLGALALPVAAIAGPGAITGVLVAVVVAALSARLFLATGPTLGKPLLDVALTLLAALPAGLAGTAPVLVRSLGLREALVLLALVWAFDAGSFVVGSGAGAAWEGPVAGAVCTIPVTLVVAAVLVHPFGGASPWVLGAIVAILAPAGQALGALLVAEPGVQAPALRRLDSLLGVGLVWAWAAASLLR